MDLCSTLDFGETSDLYKRLVEQEQKVDQLLPTAPTDMDPALFTVFARVKKTEDAVYVRDEILQTLARRRATTPSTPPRLADAKANARYSFAARASTTPSGSPALSPASSATAALTTRSTALPASTSALTPADLQAAAGSTSPTRASS